MKILEHIGRYFIMLSKIFGKFTKWNVLRPLIFKEIDTYENDLEDIFIDLIKNE